MNQLLPPGAEFYMGRIVRRVQRVEEDGSTWEEIRPVAHSLDEAQKTLTDFYDERLGWIREGRKTEVDHFLLNEQQLTPFMRSPFAATKGPEAAAGLEGE